MEARLYSGQKTVSSIDDAEKTGQLTSFRMAVLKKSISNKFWRECGEREPYDTAGRSS